MRKKDLWATRNDPYYTILLCCMMTIVLCYYCCRGSQVTVRVQLEREDDDLLPEVVAPFFPLVS